MISKDLEKSRIVGTALMLQTVPTLNADSVPQIYVRIFKNLRKSAWQYFNFEKGQPLANSRVLKPVAHIVREASRVITMLFSKRR